MGSRRSRNDTGDGLSALTGSSAHTRWLRDDENPSTQLTFAEPGNLRLKLHPRRHWRRLHYNNRISLDCCATPGRDEED